MKKTVSIMMLVLMFGLTAISFAQDEAEPHRLAFAKGFGQLLKNTEEGLMKPAVTVALSKDGTGGTFQKFNIAAVSVPTAQTTTQTVAQTTAQSVAQTATPTSCNLGIKVWFSLEDGTCFNPIKRKMGVKERFYVHIQSAVPVYVALFQNYPESDQPESKQVYPDAKYPETFKVLQAGQAVKLPVAFEMDDDTRNEIMSMVVVRADAPQIQSTLTAQAVSSVTSSDGTAVVTAQATASTDGIMKKINDQAASETGTTDSVKFAIAAPTTVTTVVSNDATFYMFGAGFVGQWQLTLRK